MTDQLRISEQPVCEECGHPTIQHYAYRMVDCTRETNGHCGDHTRCEECDLERTWDGQPLWSTSTEQERLFAGDAFKQIRGQLAIEDDAKERSTCSGCLARTYRGEECVCDDGGDAEDYDEIVWRHETA